MSFTFTRLSIPDVILITGEVLSDSRGFFQEAYRANVFSEYAIGPFVQENYSHSKKDVIRGLHFQFPPMEVGKLVSCPHGIIYDVAVDIRPDSPTYKKWVSCILQNGNGMIWVPPGFAHGFAVLSDTANVLYRQTQYYSKEYDGCIKYNDPDLGILWPVTKPHLSEKDAKASSILYTLEKRINHETLPSSSSQ